MPARTKTFDLRPRWSMMAYASTTLALGGAMAASILILFGRDTLAEPVAGLSWAWCMLQSGMASSNGRKGLADFDEPLARMRYAFLGLQTTLAYIFIGIFAKIFLTRYGDPIVFPHDQLLAGFFAAVTLGIAVPRAHRLWRGPPPQG